MSSAVEQEPVSVILRPSIWKHFIVFAAFGLVGVTVAMFLFIGIEHVPPVIRYAFLGMGLLFGVMTTVWRCALMGGVRLDAEGVHLSGLVRAAAPTVCWQDVVAFHRIGAPGSCRIVYKRDGYKRTMMVPARWALAGRDKAEAAAIQLLSDPTVQLPDVARETLAHYCKLQQP